MTSRERAEKFLDALHFPHPEADDLRFDESSYVALTAALDAHAEEAVEAEREACARTCDDRVKGHSPDARCPCCGKRDHCVACIEAGACATTIRARSKKRARRLRLDAETAKEALDED